MTFKFQAFKKQKKTVIVKEAEKYLWPIFHPHHYMTMNMDIIESLPRSSKFFTFYWLRGDEEILIGCLGVLNQISKYPARRITRLVVLPEFQGLGFSKIMLENISEMYKKEGITMYITTFHPGLGNYFEKSSSWEPSANNMRTFRTNSTEGNSLADSLRDGVAMFRYHYIGCTDYSLEYNPLKIDELQEKSKNLDNNDEEYKKIKRKIASLKRKQDPDYKEEKPEYLSTDNPEHIKAKEEHRKIFKKTKRKVLTAQERKALKAQKKTEKERDFEEF